MTYQEAAISIIKSILKSAIFIDENAKEPYSTDNPSEAIRTIELYNQFKKEGVSLSVFKYNQDTFWEQKDYVFANRDLVLLDWKLDGDENGGEKSLEILSEIVNNQNHIHFCVIYTNEKETSVLNDLLSYFSGASKYEYENYKLNLSEKEEEILDILSDINGLSLCRFTPDLKEKYNIIRRKNSNIVSFIHEIIKAGSKISSLIKCGIAFNNNIKSENPQPCPSSIDTTSSTLCINNTIISVLNKKIVKPSDLIEKLGNAVANYNWGVMHLIGLELQNIQKRKGSVIGTDILKVTKKALGYHKAVKEDADFDAFLKEVMLEQEALNLREERLTIIDAIEKEDYDSQLEEEYTSMNVFYNSAMINQNKALSFGDVFRCDDKYYICITALCDCIRPHKRNNRFYFAKGSVRSVSEGMKIGDSGFVSFIIDKEYKCVKWNDHDTPNEPTYIIPESFLVPDNMIKDKLLNVQRAVQQDDKTWTLQQLSFEYVTTIKQNYAQRIANHAFTHPVRVGVDFIGKKES